MRFWLLEPELQRLINSVFRSALSLPIRASSSEMAQRISGSGWSSALKDGDSTVRVPAVICLKTRHGLDATGKETLLQVYLNDRDSRARNAAAIALATLGKPAPQFIVALENNSRTGDEQTKKAADAALELLKKEGPPQAAENSR